MMSAARVHRAPRGAAETGYPIDPGHRETTTGPQFGAWKDCRGKAACFTQYDRMIPQAPDVLPAPDCRRVTGRRPGLRDPATRPNSSDDGRARPMTTSALVGTEVSPSIVCRPIIRPKAQSQHLLRSRRRGDSRARILDGHHRDPIRRFVVDIDDQHPAPWTEDEAKVGPSALERRAEAGKA